MNISATKLRQNLYSILDHIIESGIPVNIERKGHILKIIPEDPVNKLDRLEKHDLIVGNPGDIVHIDWTEFLEDDKGSRVNNSLPSQAGNTHRFAKPR